MDLITLATTLFHWCVPAAAAGFVLILAGYAIYRVLRKRFPSMRPLSTRQTVSLILLVLWMLLTLGLTSASRGANYTGQVNLDLFSGYRSAWNNWSLREAQLVVFNMLLFAPLGFLLPMIWKRAKAFRTTLLISLGATLLLETMQLLTGTGIFELDDLLHNLIGSLFGYFLAMLLLSALRERKIRAISVVRMLLIPCVTGAILGGAICAYAIQPYGNMPICPAIRQNLSQVEVLLETDLESTEKTMPVYKNMRAGDANYIQQVMNYLADWEGVAFSSWTRREDENKVYPGTTGDGKAVQLNWFVRTGSWTYTTWKEPAPLSAADAETLRGLWEERLNSASLLTGDAGFSLQNGNTLRWSIPRENQGGTPRFGIVMMQFDEDLRLCTLYYDLFEHEFWANEEIISSTAAFEQVKRGYFEQYLPFEPGDQLHVNGWLLSYTYDTKGFYQPVYVFSGYINSEENPWSCQIPARRS